MIIKTRRLLFEYFEKGRLEPGAFCFFASGFAVSVGRSGSMACTSESAANTGVSLLLASVIKDKIILLTSNFHAVHLVRPFLRT